MMLFCDRLRGDWDRSPPDQRRLIATKDALTLHSVTGAFTHFRNRLKVHVPKADFDAVSPNLDSQFSSGFLDAELLHLIHSGAPMIELRDCSFLRPGFDKIYQKIDGSVITKKNIELKDDTFARSGLLAGMWCCLWSSVRRGNWM